MPTRKELHDQARRDQRDRALATQQSETKPAIVGIGDRDPETGRYEVLLPDGSIEMGEKQFNSAVPTGAQVLGIPSEAGGWGLDDRDVVPNLIDPVTAEPTGKIKYLYSVLNADGSIDLWLGGWQPKPVKIKAIAANEFPFLRQILLKNTGGNGYWVDYQEEVVGVSGARTSLTERGIAYRYTYPGSQSSPAGLDAYGYSFYQRGGYGSAGGGMDFGYFGRLFQDVFIVGRNTSVYGKVYLLPNLVSPTGVLYDERLFLYNPGAINRTGTKGVGIRSDVSADGSTTTSQIATYSEAGIVDTGVTPTADVFDCFDDSFSAINTATFSTDVLSKPKFTGSIGIYGFDAIPQRTVQITVYGIPVAQRSSATLIGRPSYHPRTTTLKP